MPEEAQAEWPVMDVFEDVLCSVSSGFEALEVYGSLMVELAAMLASHAVQEYRTRLRSSTAGAGAEQEALLQGEPYLGAAKLSALVSEAEGVAACEVFPRSLGVALTQCEAESDEKKLSCSRRSEVLRRLLVFAETPRGSKQEDGTGRAL